MTAPAPIEPAAAIVYRPPRVGDGARVHALIRRCQPLDLNSVYAYLLLCREFAATCALAETHPHGLVGFVSGFRKPADTQTLFIWQVAVDRVMRGRGLSKELLRQVLCRPACVGVRFLEATISPRNDASWGLFRSLARELNAPCSDRPCFGREHFGSPEDEEHEEERLLRIGPFAVRGKDC